MGELHERPFVYDGIIMVNKATYYMFKPICAEGLGRYCKMGLRVGSPLSLCAFWRIFPPCFTHVLRFLHMLHALFKESCLM